jgi:C1A family cysteine protease
MNKYLKLFAIIFLAVVIAFAFIACETNPGDGNGGGNGNGNDNTTILPYGIQYATPVKQQIVSGPCWLFAANAVLETYIKKFTGFEVNLSENHARFAIYDGRFGITEATFPSGGNSGMTPSYWMRGEIGGPVLTNDDYPYNGINNTTWNENAPRYGRVTNVQFIPNSELEGLQNSPGYDIPYRNKIKDAINNYGSVSMGYWSSYSQKYNSPDGVSYYNNSDFDTNHFIQILGWNDNFSASNFRNPPPGNGAWYVKDSSGSANRSFHWISYYQYIQSVHFVAGFDNQPIGNVYDYTPQTRNTPYNNSLTDKRWWANIFDCEDENAYLREISIYVGSNAVYNIYVAVSDLTQNATEDYILLNNALNNKVAELTVSESEPVNKYQGYYTIKLNTPVLISNKSFAIVVEGTALNSNGARYYFLITNNDPNFNSNARESYFSSSSGTSKTWQDWHLRGETSSAYGNFFIYAIVSGSSGQSDRGRIKDR